MSDRTRSSRWRTLGDDLLAFLAWFVPHGAVVARLVWRRPGRLARSPAALYGWWLVAAPMAVTLLVDLVTGAEWAERRWVVALDVLWVGLLVPWLRLSRRSTVAAAAVIVAIAAIASVSATVRWMPPTWVEAATSLALRDDLAVEPVSEWQLHVRTIGGPQPTLMQLEAPTVGVTSPSRVILHGNTVAMLAQDATLLWPAVPHVALTASWSDGRPVAGRTFRAIGRFVAAQEAQPRGCRGWRFGWWVEGRRVQTCEPNRWPVGAVEVGRVVTIPEDAEGLHWTLSWYDVGGLEQRWHDLRVEERIGDRWEDVTWALAAGVSAQVGVPDVVADARTGTYRARLALPTGLHPNEVVNLHADGGLLLRAGQVPRWTGWSSHANVMAHLLVVALATIAALSRRSSLVLFAAPAALTAIVFTGSRSGLVAAVFIVLAAVWAHARGPWRAGLTALVVLGTASVALLSDRLGTLLRLSGPDENLLSRWEIFEVAWAAILAAPWTGDPAGIMTYATNELGLQWPALPMHAHNVWLDVGALFGLPALIGLVVWTIGVLSWCARMERLRRATLVVPIVIVSMTDVTLLVPALAVAFAAAMVILADDGEAPAAHDAPTSTR